jgi:hypothetical protein
MMREIKSIAVFQTSLVLGLVNFALGVVASVAMAISPVATMQDHPAMLLALPISYAFGAFLVTALLCLAYNVVARVVGGIEVELGPEEARQVSEMPRSQVAAN